MGVAFGLFLLAITAPAEETDESGLRLEGGLHNYFVVRIGFGNKGLAGLYVLLDFTFVFSLGGQDSIMSLLHNRGLSNGFTRGYRRELLINLIHGMNSSIALSTNY